MKKHVKLNYKHLSYVIIAFFIIFGLIYIGFKSWKYYFVNISFADNNDIVLDENTDKYLDVIIDQKDKKRLKYASDDTSVASIDENGNISAFKAGKTRIIVSVENSNAKITKNIIVNEVIKPKSISIKNKLQYLEVGKSVQLKTKIDPRNTKYKTVYYKSSNPEIASIDENGNLKANNIGKCEIIAQVKNTEVSDKFSIEVIQKKSMTSLHFVNKDKYIETGQNYQFNLKSNLGNISNRDIEYKSNNESIASIDSNGNLHSYRPGEVTITATYKDNDSIKAFYSMQIRQTKGYLSAELLDSIGANHANKLMIVAHPDDDILWGGGHLSDGGWFVVCLTNEYNKARNQEFQNAMDVVNAKRIILSYPDLVNHKRNDWSSSKIGIQKDLDRLMDYKKWDQIVTHNPEGEYGHIHHKMTDRLVTKSTKANNQFSSLYYFGKFYKEIPEGMKKLEENQLTKKQEAVSKYTTQIGAIKRNWAQMIPYENWVKADQWK